MAKTQQEIVRQGYQVLVESLGVVDTLRFIQYLNPGQGDYTQERRAWVERTSLDDILIAMGQSQGDGIAQYNEVIE